MDTTSSFVQAIHELQEGDDSAAERIFQEYFTRLVRFAQKKIAARYHAKTDPEGVAASVIRTFFRRQREEPFADLSDANQLWRLLAHIAACKCCNRVKKFRRPGAAVDRETPYPEHFSYADSVVEQGDIIVADLIEQAVLGFSDVEKGIIERTLDDVDVKDIAAEFGISTRTVLRLRKQFRSRLEKLLKKIDE